MTVRLLCAYGVYPANAIVALDAGTESGLVAAKMADVNLAGGVPYVAPPVPPVLVTDGLYVRNAAGTRYVGRVEPDGTVTSIDPSNVAITGGAVSGAAVSQMGITMAAMGDSRLALAVADPAQGNNLFSQFCILTYGRVAYAGRFATSGFTLEQQRATHLPAILALTGVQKPAFCLAGFVSNNLAQGVAWDFSATRATLMDCIAQLRAKSIEPVLIKETPRTDSSQANLNVQTWNGWVEVFAAGNGIRLLDWHTPTADPITGAWKTGMSGDNIHPTDAGIAAAAKASAAAFVNTLNTPGRVRLTRALDAASLIPNAYGLFAVDSNADGIADGLSTAADPTVNYSIVDDGLVAAGKWQRFQRKFDGAGNCTGGVLRRFDLSPTLAAGTLVEFAGVIRTAGLVAAGQNVTTNLEIRKSGAAVAFLQPVYQAIADFEGVFRACIAIPAGGCDVIRVNMQVSAPTVTAGTPGATTGGTADFGQFTVTNLTALGYV